jgi:plasmid stability protein
MANLQIKNVPEEMHEELRRRAKARRMSVRDYVLDLIEADQVLPTMQEWLAELAHIRPAGLEHINAADLIADVRAEHEADLARKLEHLDRGS